MADAALVGVTAGRPNEARGGTASPGGGGGPGRRGGYVAWVARTAPAEILPGGELDVPHVAPAIEPDECLRLVDAAVRRHHGRPSALIEVLRVAQDAHGFLSPAVLRHVARGLKLPLSRVYGVATFYHFFTLKPKGRHTFVLCTGTACYVKGSAAIQQSVERACGCRFGETTPDHAVSLVSARCVGSCGLAPVAVVDDEVRGRLTAETAAETIDALRSPSEEPVA